MKPYVSLPLLWCYSEASKVIPDGATISDRSVINTVIVRHLNNISLNNNKVTSF